MFIFSFFAPTANTSSELKLVNTKGISQNSCDRQFYQHHKHWLKIITGIGNRLLVGLETFRCSTWDRHLSANLTNGTTFCDPDLIVFFGGIFVHCKIHWCYEILWPAEHFDVALISCQYLKLVNNYLQKPKKKKNEYVLFRFQLIRDRWEESSRSKRRETFSPLLGAGSTQNGRALGEPISPKHVIGWE